MTKYISLLFIGSFLVSCSTYKDKKSIPYTPNPIVKHEKAEPKKEIVISSTPAPVSRKKENIPEKISHNEKDVLDKPVEMRVSNVIDVAKSFNGTRYKFGGTTSSGMDCSGLVYTAFKEEEIHLPRSSRDMATRGNKISFKEISKGDLVFFKTNRKSNVINHVGLVVEVLPGKVFFIHSTNSLGVIISSLDERYWNESFAEARRVI